MYGHGFMKCRDFFRKLIARLGAENFCPFAKCAASGFEQAVYFFMAHALGQGDW